MRRWRSSIIRSDPSISWKSLALTPTTSSDVKTGFPQVMTLGDGALGRKAYLSWLEEPKNLKELERIEFLDCRPKRPKRVSGSGAAPLNFLLKLKPEVNLRTRDYSMISEAGMAEFPADDEFMPGVWDMEH
ncbi:hypothetical protein BGX29_002860 [Mortierella sp. GBA35]|nr:hypothetical protein BGX29_002860 [Mortierella sp. GBA35]KAG0205030.1 hypothetical protein BGX33_008146 [Mortierella sp. NVP41]